MKTIIFLSLCLLLACANPEQEAAPEEKSQISFTFDDGSIRDMPGYDLKQWNEMILASLEKHHAKALFFPAGSFLEGEKGEYVLSSWNNAGHRIGNHTYAHPNFNSEKTSLDQFKLELLKNDSIVRKYTGFTPLFRFPYLKEGNTIEKRDGFRSFLAEQGYSLGHVTIDASDWYVNSKLLRRLKQDPKADIKGYEGFYVAHLFDRACYYDSLATALLSRKIKHNILLHHNLTSALFLDALIQKFKTEGWEIIDAEEAFQDTVYQRLPKNIPAGESLIWALAKETGKYDDVLRYPAEDSRYEKDEMERLGL